jgi:hypothetical protein
MNTHALINAQKKHTHNKIWRHTPHTHTHKHTYIYIHAHTYLQRFNLGDQIDDALAYTHTHKHIYTHLRRHKHTHLHKHPYTNTHTHAHTHTHTCRDSIFAMRSFMLFACILASLLSFSLSDLSLWLVAWAVSSSSLMAVCVCECV